VAGRVGHAVKQALEPQAVLLQLIALRGKGPNRQLVALIHVVMAPTPLQHFGATESCRSASGKGAFSHRLARGRGRRPGLAPTESGTEKELHNFAAPRLAKFKLPRKYEFLTEPLPKAERGHR